MLNKTFMMYLEPSINIRRAIIIQSVWHNELFMLASGQNLVRTMKATKRMGSIDPNNSKITTLFFWIVHLEKS